MPALVPALIISAIAMVGVLGGVRLSLLNAVSNRLVAFSGGVLAGVAAFWILPELAGYLGWTVALEWLATGFLVLWLVDRYVIPVCPGCSHTHDHQDCETSLHGFAGPMLAAAGIHSFLEGWILQASGQGSSTALARGVLLGIAIHKLPEGIALGIIVRASVQRSRLALWGCIAAEAMTVAGAAAAILLAPSWGTQWAHFIVALAAGSFLYLGYHAVHSEYKRGGLLPAFMPALTGVAGSSVIRIVGLRFFGL